MKRKWQQETERYFGIGVYRPKTALNVGTLWRSAFIYGANFIFTVDSKYKKRADDVLKVWSKIPLLQFESMEAFLSTVPYSCKIVGIEQSPRASMLQSYNHPQRAMYILGAEDSGLPNAILDHCHDLIELPGDSSLNVAVAGSIVAYDRYCQLKN